MGSETLYDEVLFRFDIAWLGWETDNKAFIAKKNNKKVLVLHNHGQPYIGTEKELRQILKDHKDWVSGIENALNLLE